MEMDPESTQRKLVDFNEEKRRQRGQHGNGGGNTVAERLARLETRIQYLATEAYIEKRVNSLLLTFIGVTVGVVGIATTIIIAWLDK